MSHSPIIHSLVSITSKPEESEPTAGVYEPQGKGSVLPVDTVVMDPLYRCLLLGGLSPLLTNLL